MGKSSSGKSLLGLGMLSWLCCPIPPLKLGKLGQAPPFGANIIPGVLLPRDFANRGFCNSLLIFLAPQPDLSWDSSATPSLPRNEAKTGTGPSQLSRVFFSLPRDFANHAQISPSPLEILPQNFANPVRISSSLLKTHLRDIPPRSLLPHPNRERGKKLGQSLFFWDQRYAGILLPRGAPWPPP